MVNRDGWTDSDKMDGEALYRRYRAVDSKLVARRVMRWIWAVIGLVVSGLVVSEMKLLALVLLLIAAAVCGGLLAVVVRALRLSWIDMLICREETDANRRRERRS